MDMETRSGGGEMADEDRLLLEFVRGRDVECPRCRYNLRDLTTPTCPECMEELRLKVGARRLRLDLLLASVVPGSFSGIAAVFLGIIVVLNMPVPWGLIALVGFGIASGLGAMALIWKREAFLRQPRTNQITMMASLWTVHILVLLILIFSIV